MTDFEDDDMQGDPNDPLAQEHEAVARYGCCPRCHQPSTGTFDAGRNCWSCCRSCKVCWWVEAGILSSTRHPEQQQKVYDEIEAAEFGEVRGCWPLMMRDRDIQ